MAAIVTKHLHIFSHHRASADTIGLRQRKSENGAQQNCWIISLRYFHRHCRGIFRQNASAHQIPAGLISKCGYKEIYEDLRDIRSAASLKLCCGLTKERAADNTWPCQVFRPLLTGTLWLLGCSRLGTIHWTVITKPYCHWPPPETSARPSANCPTGPST